MRFDPTTLHAVNDAIELIAQYTPASDRRRATVIAALADIKARELDAMDAAREGGWCVGNVEVCGE